METLIDRVPEAAAFVSRILARRDDYLLFEGEPFAQFQAGVLASSQQDRRGDRLTPEALRSLVGSLADRPVWMQANHNPLLHPIGRILAAEVFHDPESNSHFVAGVYGYFDPHKLPRIEPKLPELGEDEWRPPSGNPTGPQAQVGFDIHEIPPGLIRGLLERAPAVVAGTPSLHSRKGIDSQAIVHISVALWLLMANPFSKAFLAKLGEHAADGVVEFAKWLWMDVYAAVNEPVEPERILQLSTEVGEAQLEFLIPSRMDEDDVEEAKRTLAAATRGGAAFIKLNEHLHPRRLVLVYSSNHMCWIPHYFVCDRLGVIVAEPTSVDHTQFHGLSIGAVIKSWDVGPNEEEPKSDPNPDSA